MPKGNSGIKRSGGGGKNVTEKAEPKAQGVANITPGTMVQSSLDADDPKAMEKLRAMSERGEIPTSVRGSNDNKEKIYEAMDDMYAEPTGALANSTVHKRTPSPVEYRLSVTFNGFIQSLDEQVDVPRRTTSEKAIRGSVKYSKYKYLPAAVNMYVFRSGKGSYWDDKGGQEAWLGRKFSKTEYERILTDMYRGAEKTFGIKMTDYLKDIIKGSWKKDGDMWRISD